LWIQREPWPTPSPTKTNVASQPILGIMSHFEHSAPDRYHYRVRPGHYHRRRRREFPDFMNQIVSAYPERHLRVVLDNLNTHQPKQNRWLKRHPRVHLHFIPTHSSWLNQVGMLVQHTGAAGPPGSEFHLANPTARGHRQVRKSLQPEDSAI
jgi:hypothetical protein